MPAVRVTLFAAALLASAAGWLVAPTRPEAADEPAGNAVALKAQLSERADLQRSIATVHKLFGAARYGEALPLAEAALTNAERIHGPAHAIVSGSAYNLGVLYRRLGRPAEAIVPLRQALAIEADTTSPGSELYKRVFGELTSLYQSLGRTPEIAKLHADALEDLRDKGQTDTLDEAWYLEAFGQYLRQVAAYAEAEDMLRRALAIKERLLAGDDFALVSAMNKLAGLARTIGKLAEAEALYKRGLAIIERSKGPRDANVGIMLDNLGVLYLGLGRRAEAEVAQKRALDVLEERLGREHIEVAQVAANLAELLRQERRFGEAEPLFQRALAVFRKQLPRHDWRIGYALDNLGGLYREQGQNARARDTYQEALGTLVAGHGPSHPEVATALNNLALAEQNLGNLEGAAGHLRRALAIGEAAFGRDHLQVATGLGNLGNVMLGLGRLDEARASLTRAIAIITGTLGAEHRSILPPLGRLGEVEMAAGDFDAALGALRRAQGIEALVRQREGDAQDAAGRARHAPTIAAKLLDAVWRSIGPGGLVPNELAVETFGYGQLLTMSGAGHAVARLGARLGAGDPDLARLVRERQDLAAARPALDKRLTLALGAKAEQRNPKAEADLRRQLAGSEERISRIDAELARSYPQYAALAGPEPLSLDELQPLLARSEALLQYVVGVEHADLWLVTRSRVRWQRLDLGARALAGKVQALRCGLDPAEWAGVVRPQACLRLLGAAPENGLLPFSPAVAHDLYELLLGPFRDEIAGRDLTIVASGPLTSLPFQALVTQRPPAPDAAAGDPTRPAWDGAAWLVQRHAVAVLPSVASLKVLRLRGAVQPGAGKPYLGIANPLLLGASGQDRSAFARTQCPVDTTGEALVAMRHPTAPAADKAATYFRGGIADPRRLMSLAPLPETVDEVCTVGRTLGAGPSDLLFGADASETNLRRLAEQGELASYRVLHFATHGLVAGELDGLAEPALVLTPPTEATERDDGLLTASEVASLKLDADWVVLSACNTAAGDSLGAEPLSGLARAFFYAGARSLLVSHWPVDSAAAVKLTTRAVTELRQSTAAGRAEALRRAMLAMIEDGDHSHTHPQFWAAFSLVGEGRAPLVAPAVTAGLPSARSESRSVPRRATPVATVGQKQRAAALPAPRTPVAAKPAAAPAKANDAKTIDAKTGAKPAAKPVRKVVAAASKAATPVTGKAAAQTTSKAGAAPAVAPASAPTVPPPFAPQPAWATQIFRN